MHGFVRKMIGTSISSSSSSVDIPRRSLFGRRCYLWIMTPLIVSRNAATKANGITANTRVVSTTTTSHSSSVNTTNSSKSNIGPSIFVIRHGDRWDYNNPDWAKSDTSRKGDSPLSDLGHVQALETGVFLDSILSNEGISDADAITLLCSPFLRCIQTANEILRQFRHGREKVKIKLEHSVWEMDGHDGVNHRHIRKDISQERFLYFPRIDTSHAPLFIPNLPESKEESLIRFQRVMEAIHQTYYNDCRPTNNPQVLIIVTHAAACIGIVKAATGKELHEITPAGPCSVYRLQKKTTEIDGSNNRHFWDIDPYWRIPEGLNGHMQHITNAGQVTIPWNNYGPRCPITKRSKYTGPPRSEIERRFPHAQPEYTDNM